MGTPNSSNLVTGSYPNTAQKEGLSGGDIRPGMSVRRVNTLPTLQATGVLSHCIVVCCAVTHSAAESELSVQVQLPCVQMMRRRHVLQHYCILLSSWLVCGSANLLNAGQDDRPGQTCSMWCRLRPLFHYLEPPAGQLHVLIL